MDEDVRRFRIECDEAVTREWLIAEAFEAGAAGAEEREGEGGYEADIYATPEMVETVRTALAGIEAPGVRLGEAEAIPEVDWQEAWKDGLEALEISERLLIRPPFIEASLRPGQQEIVIDPGQAFGTGNHASTRLCLEWIDELILGEAAASARKGNTSGPEVVFDRVLDVGSGSGVLALAAVALGAGHAMGFDLDPVATEAARVAADANGLAERVRFVTGPIEEVAPADEPYPLVVANLLKREVLAIAGEVAARVSGEGRLVLAGLLEEDLAEVLDRFGAEGFALVGRRQYEDAIGVWVGPCLARA